MAENSDMRKRYYMDEIETARKQGEFPCGTRKLRIFEGTDNYWTVNMAQEDEQVNELDAEALTAAEVSQRRQIPIIIDFMRKYVPALRNVRLVDSASDIGIRESRRIIGRTVFSLDDIMESRRYNERIAVCANSIDIHESGKVSYSLYKGEHNYYIPLSCLISRNRDNLLAAGKCLSADKFAHAAVRVMPPCFAMGQAVGVTAALAVKLDVLPCDVSVGEVQKVIIANGGYLE